MAFVKVGTLRELPPGKSKQVSINGCTVALFNVNGTCYAINDSCPHRGGPLSEGELQGSEVLCPWHGAAFDLATGAHRSPPARSGVPAYKVQVVGDDILVEVS